MIDRHMIPLDRWLSASRHFHGDWRSAELHIQTWVLFHDFMPYCPRAKIRERAIVAPPLLPAEIIAAARGKIKVILFGYVSAVYLLRKQSELSKHM